MLGLRRSVAEGVLRWLAIGCGTFLIALSAIVLMYNWRDMRVRQFGVLSGLDTSICVLQQEIDELRVRQGDQLAIEDREREIGKLQTAQDVVSSMSIAVLWNTRLPFPGWRWLALANAAITVCGCAALGFSRFTRRGWLVTASIAFCISASVHIYWLGLFTYYRT